MNPRLGTLNPYPFERLRGLLAQAGTPTHGLTPINLSIGEPKHDTPAVIVQAMQQALGGLSVYPPTKGSPAVREAIAGWISRRYGIAPPNPDTQVLPVAGSREALFAFAQVVVDAADDALVVCPNPFYQIYEGAALLAGAQPWYLNAVAENNFALDWASVPADVWNRTRLLYVCTPGNPAGNVMTLDDWRTVFELADRHDFIIAADECYSEIYFDESHPPLGSLQAAVQLGRDDFHRLVSFSSLSKRSNVPGLRSGFVAGDAAIVADFLRYRTYHGCAMSNTVQAASVVAWNDEAHVDDNRRLYREKFARITPMLSPWLRVEQPDAGFYLWAATPLPDTEFARRLQAEYNVTVLPGSYLAREANGINPGAGFVRIALVADTAECVEAAERVVAFCQKL